MAFLKVDQENSADIELYYEDQGSGPPVILIHGWPLSGRSWEKQVPVLVEAGFRVITYDRRGFGQSSKPMNGYDSRTLAQDLNTLIDTLDLRDITLVGFSMGGVEVARYLEVHGADRVRKAVFMGAVTPFLLKTEGNPEGVDAGTFNKIREALIEDRPKFLAEFFKDFYNVGFFDDISEEAVRMSWMVGVNASPIGSLKAVDAWLEDYRSALRNTGIPILVVHGEADKIVPIDNSGARMKKLIPECIYHPIMGAPHGMLWTHAKEINHILLQFLGESAVVDMPKRSAVAPELPIRH